MLSFPRSMTLLLRSNMITYEWRINKLQSGSILEQHCSTNEASSLNHVTNSASCWRIISNHVREEVHKLILHLLQFSQDTRLTLLTRHDKPNIVGAQVTFSIHCIPTLLPLSRKPLIRSAKVCPSKRTSSPFKSFQTTPVAINLFPFWKAS